METLEQDMTVDAENELFIDTLRKKRYAEIDRRFERDDLATKEKPYMKRLHSISKEESKKAYYALPKEKEQTG